jgi:hypothetical protein
MPYSFDEQPDELEPQPQGGDHREPPRTGVLVDMLDPPEPRSPEPSIRPAVARNVAILLLVAVLIGIVLLLVQSRFHFPHS